MKKTTLKGWVEKLLSAIVCGWIMFIATTIDNVLENKIYDSILLVWTILAIGSFYLLQKYGKCFEEDEI